MRRDFILGVADRCSSNGLFVCEGMRLAAPEMNGTGRSKGLSRSFGWRVRDGKDDPQAPRFLGLTYRGNGKAPLVVNFCPWCGADLRESAQGTQSTQSTQSHDGTQKTGDATP